MAKEWTPEKIAALTPRDRAHLYENAEKAGTAQGEALMNLILKSELPFDDGNCAGMDDSIVLEMHRVIFSNEGRTAAVEAAAKGIPPMAVLDPMIAGKLGDRYGKHNMTTHTAGGLVADLMREMGYHDSGKRAKLPEDCIARTAQIWDRKIG